MAKYGAKAQKSVETAMRKRKKGTLKSGKSGKTVTSKEQAIAIGLSEARKEGAKVPTPKKNSKKSPKKKTTTQKARAKKTPVKKKTTAKKSKK